LINLQPGDEYFIMDGGSTDGSIEIIRQYESHLTGWVSEPDKGQYDALVKGFQRCTGEFLCWINSGDLLLKNSLQVARTLLAETGADLIFGDDLYIDEKSRVIFYSYGGVASLEYMMLYGGWTPLQDACFWRRSLYEQVGGLNPDLKYAADYDFFLRASWNGRCCYIPKVFSTFREHKGQRSIAGKTRYQAEKQQSRKQMLAKLGVSLWQRFIYEPGYWVAVRWWYRVTRRFYYSKTPTGVAATTITVM
jgi:glycosyltransferase involved in cell wall biosynthesis